MAPDWVLTLPSVNAILNGIATILLAIGFVLVKQKKLQAHKRVMLTSFGVSVLFLICYLTYHFALAWYTGSSSRKYAGEGWDRTLYLGILITHIVLAAITPVLAIWSIVRALRGNLVGHRKLAKITWPIWMYVSVTGVIIYLMLYHGPGAPAA